MVRAREDDAPVKSRDTVKDLEAYCAISPFEMHLLFMTHRTMILFLLMRGQASAPTAPCNARLWKQQARAEIPFLTPPATLACEAYR